MDLKSPARRQRLDRRRQTNTKFNPHALALACGGIDEVRKDSCLDVFAHHCGLPNHGASRTTRIPRNRLRASGEDLDRYEDVHWSSGAKQ